MKATFNKIAVIGLGYIGLPTAAVLASRGLNVVGVDIDENTVKIVNHGKVHSIEPDLDS
jgi:UDP-N-acetyl-D-mannosaminuronic acid dehydrogenase